MNGKKDPRRLFTCPWCLSQFEARKGARWIHAPDGMDNNRKYCTSKCLQGHSIFIIAFTREEGYV